MCANGEDDVVPANVGEPSNVGIAAAAAEPTALSHIAVCAEKEDEVVKVRIDPEPAAASATAGKPPEDGAAAAPAAPAPLGRVRMRDVAGLTYPSFSYADLCHPMVVLFALLSAFADMSSVLAPAAWFDGQEAPMLAANPDMSTAARKYCLLNGILKSVGAWAAASEGVTSLRVTYVNIATFFVLNLVFQWLNGAVSLGYGIALFAYPLWAYRFNVQKCYVFTMIYISGACSLAFLYFLLAFNKIQGMVPNPVLAGCLAPAVATGFTAVIPRLPDLTARRLAFVGLPPYNLAWLTAAITSIGDMLRLIDMIKNGNEPQALLSNMVLSILSEVSCRMCAVPRIWYGITSGRYEVDLGTDLYLRLRFTTSYATPMAMIPYLALALLTGAPWARQAGTWCGLLAYCAACVASDLAITGLHQRAAPAPGKGFWARARELAATPRAHWPWCQPQTPMAQQELWAPSALSVRFRWARDELLSAVVVLHFVNSFGWVAMVTFLGPCGLTVHADRCAE